METTIFAPAGRADEQQLSRQQQAVTHAAFITAVLNAVPDFMLVLNDNRQIVAANSKLLAAFGVEDQSALVGKRPGEAVNCVHSSEGPDGCGTAESCSACGAVLTIMESSQFGEQAEGECRIMIGQNGGTALDMAVTATPLDVDGTAFTLFALKDISSEKRRQVLERVFFHDVLNTVGGMRGIASLLVNDEDLPRRDRTEYKQMLVKLSDDLAEEITQQSRLLSAERGEYIPEMEDTDLGALLQEICSIYKNHIRTPDRDVLLEKFTTCHITTDRAMLRRVVGNMVLNALEATPVGGAVKVCLIATEKEVWVLVTNAGEIPKDIQLRLFKRSFSTKAEPGRGIGTYSMKLFGERYLGGKVGFHSVNGETRFFIKLPAGDDTNRKPS
jgi:signal transduction histidine kinase